MNISVLGINNKDKELTPAIPCIGIKKLALYTKSEIDLSLFVSPVESGDCWFKVGTMISWDDAEYFDICAARFKIVSNGLQGEELADLHIVGQK